MLKFTVYNYRNFILFNIVQLKKNIQKSYYNFMTDLTYLIPLHIENIHFQAEIFSLLPH